MALNHAMQQFQVAFTARIQGNIVSLILESTEGIPHQSHNKKRIKHFLERVQIAGINIVEIYAKHASTQALAWYSKFEITVPPPLPQSCAAPQQPTTATTSFFTAVQYPLPQPISFNNLPSDLQNSIQQAGLRPGNSRSWVEANQMYNKIPENIRRQGIDSIYDFKSNHDWSHYQSHSNGGSARPSNGDWEPSSINRARGGQNVTAAEKQAMLDAKAQINFTTGAGIVFQQAAKSAGIAFGLEFAFSGLENFIAVQQGEKSVERALIDTLRQSSYAAVTAAVVTGGVVAISLAFPPIGAAISAVTPALCIIGVASCVYRLVNILSRSGKVQGIGDLMTKVDALMVAYGLDNVELNFRDLELQNFVEQELQRLKPAPKFV